MKDNILSNNDESIIRIQTNKAFNSVNTPRDTCFKVWWRVF